MSEHVNEQPEHPSDAKKSAAQEFYERLEAAEETMTEVGFSRLPKIYLGEAVPPSGSRRLPEAAIRMTRNAYGPAYFQQQKRNMFKRLK